jgi:hypothetical protein
MASSSGTIAATGNTSTPLNTEGVGSFGQRGVSRWLWPSFFDLIVVSLPIWFYALADGGVGLLLSDADTGWHIRTGDWILQNGQFVHGDLFSFTKPGQTWFAWEWLTDVIFSLLHSAMGIKGILLYGIILSTLFCAITLRHMVWRGANVFIALPLALMGFGAATVHMLARPHLWTMVLVAASFWLTQRDLKQPTKWVWALVPLTLVWTNLHGGWLALIAILGLTAVGTAIEAWTGTAQWKTVWRYLALAAACFSVSIVNPYGWRLHAHMYEYMSSSWINELIGEFKSPTFQSENMRQFEILLLLSLGAAGAALLRRRFVGPLLILFWAHNCLVSARHIPLFVAVSLPFLADELQRAWNYWTASAKRGSVPAILENLAEEAQGSLGRTSLWSIVPFVVVALPLLSIPWPQDLPSFRFPVTMAAKHKELLINSRLYTEDQWADYLIYRASPRQKVFFDGRSDFYGETISRDYCLLMNGSYRWKELMNKYGFNAVLIRPTWALASLLKQSPDWRVVDDDTKAILFTKVEGASAAPKIGVSGANEKP